MKRNVMLTPIVTSWQWTHQKGGQMSTSAFTRMVFVVLAGLALLAPSIASAQVSAVPPGAQRCADDFGTCTPPSNWTGGNLYYGASGKFVEILVGPTTEPFVCHSNTFGIADRVTDVKKSCYLSAGAGPAQAAPVAPTLPIVERVPQEAQSCAADMGACTPPPNLTTLSNGKPYYGASGRTRSRVLRRGVVTSVGSGQTAVDDSRGILGSEGCDGKFVNGSLSCQ